MEEIPPLVRTRTVRIHAGILRFRHYPEPPPTICRLRREQEFTASCLSYPQLQQWYHQRLYPIASGHPGVWLCRRMAYRQQYAKLGGFQPGTSGTGG